MLMSNVRENYLNFRGYKTWYVVHGEGQTGAPLFVVHGGPGFPHNSLNNTARLAEHGYPVVLYDQLGCGLSDRPNDTSLWVVDTFVEELNELRKHLGFDKINLLGQSWGGSLAIEYCLKYSEHVARLVIHSPLIDSRLWVEEAGRLKDQMPNGQGAWMRQLEQRGDTDNDEYQKLSDLFDETFVMRVMPKPQEYLDTINGAGLEVYHTMWGPSEAFATGTLKAWSVVDRLKDVMQPTLLISGRYDEATPKQMQIVADNIPGARWEMFENSSHCANLEEPDKYLKTVAKFLGSKS
jgi:proline-specific peptidase